MSLREKLKDRSHLRTKKIDTPALGEGSGVLIRDITVGDRFRLWEACRKPAEAGKDDAFNQLEFAAGLIHLAVLDPEDGKPLFGSAQEALDCLDDETFNLLSTEASRAAGLGQDARKEALGNSETTAGGGSSSA